MENEEIKSLSFGQRFWGIIAGISLILGIFLGNAFTSRKNRSDPRSLDVKSWKDSSDKKATER